MTFRRSLLNDLVSLKYPKNTLAKDSLWSVCPLSKCHSNKWSCVTETENLHLLLYLYASEIALLPCLLPLKRCNIVWLVIGVKVSSIKHELHRAVRQTVLSSRLSLVVGYRKYLPSLAFFHVAFQPVRSCTCSMVPPCVLHHAPSGLWSWPVIGVQLWNKDV